MSSAPSGLRTSCPSSVKGWKVGSDEESSVPHVPIPAWTKSASNTCWDLAEVPHQVRKTSVVSTFPGGAAPLFHFIYLLFIFYFI